MKFVSLCAWLILGQVWALSGMRFGLVIFLMTFYLSIKEARKGPLITAMHISLMLCLVIVQYP